MELSGVEVREDLFESVNARWEEDQITFQDRKVRIESEQTDLNNEISEIQSQVSHFQELKKISRITPTIHRRVNRKGCYL